MWLLNKKNVKSEIFYFTLSKHALYIAVLNKASFFELSPESHNQHGSRLKFKFVQLIQRICFAKQQTKKQLVLLQVSAACSQQ